MKERGILFSAPMIRALLEDRKTVTRRLVNERTYLVVDGDETTGRVVEQSDPSFGALATEHARCPYGVPGDRLWVRETWARLTGNGHRIVYRADGEDPRTGWDDVPAEKRPRMKWSPAIHLCRIHSRITLDVIDVRVERLHAITEQDAIAEGVSEVGFPRETFEKLWGEINGPESWAANPWVWRVEFRRAS